MVVLKMIGIEQIMLRQSIKESAGLHAATLVTKINFDGHGPQLDGQIETQNVDKGTLHVQNI